MDNEVQKSHSCSSSTCNGWRNQNCDVVFRGGGVSTIDGVSPVCLCGEKTVVRIARTAKNRGKQFWSCPKYKTRHEGGCNFFKWCCEDGNDKSYMNVKWEEKHECLSKTGEMGGGSKMMSDLIKSVNVVEKWMKVLTGLQCYIIINARSGRPTVSIARPTSSMFPSVRSGRPPSCIALPTTSVLKTIRSGRPPSSTARPTTSVLKTVWSGRPPSCIAFPTTSVFKTVRSGRPPSCIAFPTTSVLQTVRSGRPPSCIALPSTSLFPTVRSGRPPSSVRSPSLSLPHLLLLYTFQPLLPAFQRSTFTIDTKSYSCSSSTCNGWRNQNCDVVFRGGGVSTIDGVSPLCLCGEKTVVRIARTAKNRGKQFWSCPKYKTGHEGGCNFFKWCCEDGDDKSYMNVKWEEKHECLSKTGEMGGGSKMMSDLIKSVNVVEKWMK
ncbi:hypothetical protein LR48_Vigan03g046700 [Vigna angularis]|uniref:GRF-type domain-containing protein n=1 Tax=Phaseolus angularis TaxID=3914 RepID=A0A0L9U2U0_PHAAN|nr:hypothetical protein LR48_Vigan03g046700 [Vigna angularis]